MAIQRYQNLLERAHDINIISTGEYHPAKMQYRNKWLVDNCDLVLALWNGSKGCTANCINYANKKRKPIKNLWDKYTVCDVL